MVLCQGVQFHEESFKSMELSHHTDVLCSRKVFYMLLTLKCEIDIFIDPGTFIFKSIIQGLKRGWQCQNWAIQSWRL